MIVAQLTFCLALAMLLLATMSIAYLRLDRRHRACRRALDNAQSRDALHRAELQAARSALARVAADNVVLLDGGRHAG